MTKSFFFSKKFLGGILFSFFLVIYILTLCPTVFWWDSGEFIANIAVLGIPHRPGFPIYVLLGKIFTFLPFSNFAMKINLLSALFSAFSLLIFYFAFFEILDLFFSRMSQKKTAAIVSALAFVLVLGFTYSFWMQAVRAEVYSLSLLFFSLLLYLVLRYLATRHLKYIYLFFFLLGLGLGNHHVSLLSTIPALFFLLSCSSAHNEPIIPDFSFVVNSRRFPLYVLFLLLGLSVYLYLPIRSSGNPILVWGDTKSISGSASSVFALESLKNLDLDFLPNISEKISGIMHLFYDQLTLLCFLISLAGTIFLAKYGKRILIFILLLLLGNSVSIIFMATQFISTNPDLHGYLFASLFGLALSYGLGALFIIAGIRNRSPILRYFALVVFLFISLVPLSKHFTYANLSNNRIAYNYGYNTIRDLDSNSVVLVDNVNLNFILRELQYAEGIRNDLNIIDRGRLSFPWYADQKRRELTNIFSDISGNLSGEAFFHTILEKCLDRNIPAYMEFTEVDSNFVNHLIPSGYVFEISKKQIDPIPKEALLTQKKWEKDTFFDLNDNNFKRDWDAQRVFALSLYRLGLFYEKKGMISYALDKLERVRKIDPHNEELASKIKGLKTAYRLSRTDQ